MCFAVFIHSVDRSLVEPSIRSSSHRTSQLCFLQQIPRSLPAIDSLRIAQATSALSREAVRAQVCTCTTCHSIASNCTVMKQGIYAIGVFLARVALCPSGNDRLQVVSGFDDDTHMFLERSTHFRPFRSTFVRLAEFCTRQERSRWLARVLHTAGEESLACRL